MVAGDLGVVVLVFGDACVPKSPLIEARKYRTREGIGMGSTRSEIVDAYGPPATEKETRDVEELRYDDPPAAFGLRDDRVVHMQFRKPRN